MTTIGNRYPPGSYKQQQDFYDVKPEEDRLCGVVFQQDASGQMRPLKWSGETSHETGPGGPDIGPEAVARDTVLITVDGIHQSFEEHQRQIHELLHEGSDLGVAWPADVIGIHEGSGTTILHDSARQAGNLLALKSAEAGLMPPAWAESKIFANDPAVKAVRDQVQQCLDNGRKVILMTHSGGGIESALALALLAGQGNGAYKEAIGSRVRVLSLASGVAREDFEAAGVKRDNIYYTGSRTDLAWQLAKQFLPDGLGAALKGIYYWADGAPSEEILAHSPDYLFAANGTESIKAFLDGGPGGYFEVP
ncbi:MAG: hypothetical protein AB7S38_10110 [Vulcanimicrobiota bacterium]